ncbi:MAG: Nudix family hydrolase [Burkholderiales bacterium]
MASLAGDSCAVVPPAYVDVVCAVIQKSNGEFLLAQRPADKVYAGYWEFPGGKIEPGESEADATARELDEELGITVEQSYPWLTRCFVYPHANVRLHFRRVPRWRGDLHGKENQAFAWQQIENVSVAPLLPANGPILKALALPVTYGITHAQEIGEALMLDRLRAALDKGLRLIQVREKGWPRNKVEPFARQVMSIASPFNAQVMINGDVELAQRMGAAGVHLTAKQLMTSDARPDVPLCAASCHDEKELQQVVKLGLDFVVLGPVLPTQSHTHIKPLGWVRFSELIKHYPLPVYGLGGLAYADLESAWRHGAHGIAMQRGAWH